jgi:ubiquitin carboxyl-terminal hydrolase 25
MLPTLLERRLHESDDHILFNVAAKPPESRTDHARKTSTNSTSAKAATSLPSSPRSAKPPTSPTPPSSSMSATSSSPPPSADEVRQAVPHPNAYYCPKHNGWVLLIWKSSSVLPPLADKFDERTLPDRIRRKKTNSCVGDGEQPFGQANKTHHFHHYSKAVDARKMEPHFHRQAWEKEEVAKRNRRKVTTESLHVDLPDGLDPTKILDVPMMMQDEPEQMEEDQEEELLDLYICCQCSFYCVVSDVIPGVIPLRALDALVQDKTQNPAPGMAPEVSVFTAWDTIMGFASSI